MEGTLSVNKTTLDNGFHNLEMAAIENGNKFASWVLDAVRWYGIYQRIA